MNRFFTLLLAASCLTAVGQVPDYVPIDGLVAWYALNGNAQDAASHDWHGEVFGAQGGVDRYGNQQGCLVFDGVDDFIQTELLPVSGSQSRTFAFWAKTSTLHTQGDAAGMDILCFGGPDEIGKVNEISLNHVCEGLSFDISSGVMTKQCDVTSGDWHFYALVVSSNGAGDVGFESVQFYQNGELLSEICSLGPYSTTINTGSSSPMTIGAYFNASIRFFDGSLDDLGVWDRALSAAEIGALYSTLQPIQGCTDEAACNFNVDAILDDGTCDPFTCKCLEGTIWSEELGGCIVANPADINLDGCVQLNDLLDLLSAFGDCGAEESAWHCGDPLEYQGYVYETVQIGEQCWFAENLRAEHYRNGDPIIEATSNADWVNVDEGAFSVYLNEVYYNGFSSIDERGVCPQGWSSGSDGSWIALAETVGGLNQAGDALRSESWNGSNESGFSCFPKGYRRWFDGQYLFLMGRAYFWTETLNDEFLNDFRVFESTDAVEVVPNNTLNDGFSIRCLKDTEE